ncbi:hypothetical protein BDF22DRAFT_360297 [Syncephalis plumigaleata]|nr:hypothetical protein BDF22DRAFT_360297 [Syncephalis plumigaleata]
MSLLLTPSSRTIYSLYSLLVCSTHSSCSILSLYLLLSLDLNPLSHYTRSSRLISFLLLDLATILTSLVRSTHYSLDLVTILTSRAPSTLSSRSISFLTLTILSPLSPSRHYTLSSRSIYPFIACFTLFFFLVLFITLLSLTLYTPSSCSFYSFFLRVLFTPLARSTRCSCSLFTILVPRVSYSFYSLHSLPRSISALSSYVRRGSTHYSRTRSTHYTRSSRLILCLLLDLVTILTPLVRSTHYSLDLLTILTSRAPSTLSSRSISFLTLTILSLLSPSRHYTYSSRSIYSFAVRFTHSPYSFYSFLITRALYSLYLFPRADLLNMLISCVLYSLLARSIRSSLITAYKLINIIVQLYIYIYYTCIHSLLLTNKAATSSTFTHALH